MRRTTSTQVRGAVERHHHKCLRSFNSFTSSLAPAHQPRVNQVNVTRFEDLRPSHESARIALTTVSDSKASVACSRGIRLANSTAEVYNGSAIAEVSAAYVVSEAKTDSDIENMSVTANHQQLDTNSGRVNVKSIVLNPENCADDVGDKPKKILEITEVTPALPSKRQFASSMPSPSPRLSLAKDGLATTSASCFLAFTSCSRRKLNSFSLWSKYREFKPSSNSARQGVHETQERLLVSAHNARADVETSPRSGLPAPARYFPLQYTFGTYTFGKHRLQECFFRDKSVFQGRTTDDHSPYSSRRRESKCIKATSIKSSLKVIEQGSIRTDRDDVEYAHSAECDEKVGLLFALFFLNFSFFA
ncbi:hypothetical protein Tcan_17663 [Toxocara canis]|uniref:Uncharacterized protein n=2 Tax=Toxocara canis TaxID=6265 RepID=A0A0B2UPD0_TOXCA|nr:hypothetical protein Tcan_17663 [Toxocara canis]VDM24777.1 unnamed protein product [Toxocara canis]